MANINHSVLTDPHLHEPKGVAAASAGSVYVANGSGSGDWKQVHSYVNGYVDFDSTTPAYVHAVTTSFTPLNPTFNLGVVKSFTGASSPNARLVFTGSVTQAIQCNFTFNFKQASGTDYNLEVVFYKNGVAMNGGHIIVTASSGSWKSATLTDAATISTNDYIEIMVKGSSAFNLDIASAVLTIFGVPA